MGRAETGDAIEVNAPSPPTDVTPAFYVLRGKASVLERHAMLVELSARCEQTGAMDHIAFFLNASMNQNKTPYLILAARVSLTDLSAVRSEDLVGAAVVYEYKVAGWPTRVFVTDDGSGNRTVIAPPAQRSRLTIQVCEHLMGKGAAIALLSYREDVDPRTQEAQIAATVTHGGFLWGSQMRGMSTYLRLHESFDETLAHLGRHTRRNLRYYRRRAETELGSRFYPEVKTAISKAGFLELNGASTHPVKKQAIIQRYDDLERIPDTFCVGIRAKDGRWLSLMGGRRHHGLTEVDWQLNRAGMERLSLGTVMRSYFLENEVAFGTERLTFEGGTPHTMRHSLLTEIAVDIIALRPSWQLRVLRAFSRSRYGPKNFLLQTLSSTSIRWQRL